MKKFLGVTVLAAIGLMTVASTVSAQTILGLVKQRGALNCGVHTGLAGFGVPDAQGNWTGLDVDYCRAIASAIFNDPSKVRYIPLVSKDRFTVVQSGEVDVLIRNTTWTMSRDASLGVLFAGVNYYDGQSFMVRKKLGVNSVLQLSGASVCTLQGTTSELNVADYFRANNLKYEVVSFAGSDEAMTAYEAGRCDAITNDASSLYSVRLKLASPDEHLVLPEIISKEPLGPAVRSSDPQWFNLVKWTHFSMLNAEELGVTQANVDQQLKSDNPEVKRLLGVEGKFGEQVGLTSDWVVRIVKHVGNYGESFERNLGQGSPLKIARGQNGLWSKGGLQYAPPIR